MNKISTFIKTSILSIIAMVGLFTSVTSASEVVEVTNTSQEFSLWDAYLNHPGQLLADASNPFGVTTILKPDAASEDDLQTSIVSVVNKLLGFLGLGLLLIIIYSGVKIIFSDGDEEAVTAARTTIMYAVLGVVVIVLSYTLVDFIANFSLDTGE